MILSRISRCNISENCFFLLFFFIDLKLVALKPEDFVWLFVGPPSQSVGFRGGTQESKPEINFDETPPCKLIPEIQKSQKYLLTEIAPTEYITVLTNVKLREDSPVSGELWISDHLLGQPLETGGFPHKGPVIISMPWCPSYKIQVNDICTYPRPSEYLEFVRDLNSDSVELWMGLAVCQCTCPGSLKTWNQMQPINSLTPGWSDCPLKHTIRISNSLTVMKKISIVNAIVFLKGIKPLPQIILALWGHTKFAHWCLLIL